MKAIFRNVRGTTDLFPIELAKRNKIETHLKNAVKLFGYQEIETPFLEHSFLFEKSLGTSSEVVMKEMFRLQERDEGNQIVLRPENTASCLRAVINSGLQHSLPLHYFYCGPQFRYERPQKGRARQFRQFGVESFGLNTEISDVECILSAIHAMKNIDLLDQIEIKINTLGESESSRKQYNEALKQHFATWTSSSLSEETKARIIDGRLLRVLDSKNPMDFDCIRAAPKLLDFLPKKDVDRFDLVCSMLRNDYGVNNLTVDHRLVRGLDYYSHTCFEFISKSNGLAILAGGRYDNLPLTLGYDKSPIPAIGWAAGMERLLLLCNMEKTTLEPSIQLLIVPIFEDSNDKNNKSIQQLCGKIATRIRMEGVSCRIFTSSSNFHAKKVFKEAEHIGAKAVCFLGTNEMANKTISVRDIATGEVLSLSNDDDSLAKLVMKLNK